MEALSSRLDRFSFSKCNNRFKQGADTSPPVHTSLSGDYVNPYGHFTNLPRALSLDQSLLSSQSWNRNTAPSADPVKSTQSRLRILCLHGYGGSASNLSSQVDSLASTLAPYADLIYMDAPSLEEGDYGWWHAKSQHFGEVIYEGWERTRQGLIRKFAADGPFDGVLGFSQGAILTGVLCGLNAGPEGSVSEDTPFKFSFAIMVGGFKARDDKLAKLFDRKELYKIPSLHVYGMRDVVVSPASSRNLARMFTRPTILTHKVILPRQADPKYSSSNGPKFVPSSAMTSSSTSTLIVPRTAGPRPSTAAPSLTNAQPRTSPSNGMRTMSPAARRSAGQNVIEMQLWHHVEGPQMKVYFPCKPISSLLPAIVVFRGGAYSTALGSGSGAAQWVASQGFVGIDVEYGTAAMQRFYPDNISDGARAVRLVRAHAGKWGICPHQIAVMGFSAGAHLAATLATQPNLSRDDRDDLVDEYTARPDLVILAYGVLSFVEGYRSGAYVNSVSNFFGTTRMTEKDRRKLSPELQVTNSTPPAFVWTVKDDYVVPPSQSVLFKEACEQAGVPVDFIMYKQGSHGIGLALDMGIDASEWTQRLLVWLDKQWN